MSSCKTGTIVTVVFVLSLFALSLGCSRKVDLNGTWKGKMSSSKLFEQDMEVELDLKEEGGAVTGTMIIRPIKEFFNFNVNGTMEKGKLSFKAEMPNSVSLRGTNYATPQMLRDMSGNFEGAATNRAIKGTFRYVWADLERGVYKLEVRRKNNP